MSAHIKRGLVLAGGGALGSYQCGALLAFKEAGIRFEAVAGTSVGGLNAALWSCGRLNEGNDFWSSVNYDKVYPAKSKVLNRLPGRVRHRLLKLMLVANICTALLLGQPVPQQVARQRPLLATLTSAAVSSVLAGGYALFSTVSDTHSLSDWVPGILVWVFSFSTIRRWQLRKARAYEGMGLFRVGCMAMLVVSGLALSLLSRPRNALYLLAVGVLVAIAFRMFRGVMLKSDALGQAIQSILGDATPDVPTYVTVATQARIYDPLSGGYKRTIPITGPAGVDFSTLEVEYVPITEHRWIPHYLELSQSSSSPSPLQCLLATTALPFGVVPSITIDGRRYVDGGVIDNIPIAPLLKHDLDEIFVVLLDANGDDAEFQNGLRDAISRYRRDEVLHSISTPPPVKATMDSLSSVLAAHPALRAFGEIAPLTSFRPNLPRVRVFRPKQPRGGFADGLLRFEAKFCQQLISDGLHETRVALAKQPA